MRSSQTSSLLFRNAPSLARTNRNRRRLQSLSRAVNHQPSLVESLESRTLFSAFDVTTAVDDGPGSFRQAINDANANLGHDTITFHIGTGLVQIQPLTALPDITEEL